ncbi:MAG: hypothetical protein L0287_09055 [Anaerolineae bacterium]|nr:hypothetical protein [Anaerolineae bacterium]
MTTFVLIVFVWTGINLEGTPIKDYKEYNQCIEALNEYRQTYKQIDVEKQQLVCWPKHERKK